METTQILAEGSTFAAAEGFLSSFWLLIAIPLASAAVLLLLGPARTRGATCSAAPASAPRSCWA